MTLDREKAALFIGAAFFVRSFLFENRLIFSFVNVFIEKIPRECYNLCEVNFPLSEINRVALRHHTENRWFSHIS